jgi:hypothetical protein
MLFLGLIINARRVAVAWLLQKRTYLRDEILTTLKYRRGQASPIVYSSILGKLRSASRVVPSWGVYITWLVDPTYAESRYSCSVDIQQIIVRQPSDTRHDLQNPLPTPSMS